MDSKIGLVIQFSGIFLVTLLFVFLSKSLKSTALKYWEAAWISVSFALLSLHIAFDFEARLFFVFYYLGEYAFAFLLISGCRSFVSEKTIAPKNWFLLIPALLVSLFLVFPANDFNVLFNFHTFILATAFSIAFFALKPLRKLPQKNFGLRVMKFALALLALDFFHYTIIFTLKQTSLILPLPENYLTFNPIIDLVLEILLGFGMVIVLMEKVRHDVEETNDKLQAANEKLEKLAHVDPLTTAFTRHAFYGFLQKHNKDGDAVSGCAGVFDIDNLKPINDRFGHTVGDVAIGSVAHAIRSLVRADDLIFRWGGDEFFVVMLGFTKEQAAERMRDIDAQLEDIKLFGLEERISIRVSFGFADFNDIDELKKSVAEADAEMYLAKQKKKSLEKLSKADNSSFPVQTTNSESRATLYQ